MPKIIRKAKKYNSLPSEVAEVSKNGELMGEFAHFLQERGVKVPRSATSELTTTAGKLLLVEMGEEEYNPEIIPIEVLEKMRVDSQVAIGLAILKLPVLAQGFSVVCKDPVVRGFVKTTLSKIWRQLLQAALTSIDYGYVVAEEVYERKRVVVESGDAEVEGVLFDKEAIVIKKVKDIYPDENIRLNFDKHNNLESFTQTKLNGEEVTVPGWKMYHFAVNDDFGNAYGRTRMASCYLPWYLKVLTSQFLMRHLERRGSPSLIGFAPPGTTKDGSGTAVDNLTEISKVVRSLLSHSVATLPYQESKQGKQQWGIDVLESKGKSAESFLEVLSYFDTHILRGLLIPERAITQDAGTGTYSMSQTHADFLLLSIEGTTKSIEDSINTYIIPSLLRYNFPKVTSDECKIIIDTLQFGKKEFVYKVFSKILDATGAFLKNTGGVPYDALPDLSKMAEVLEVPLTPLELFDFGLGKEQVDRMQKIKKDNGDSDEDEKKEKNSNGNNNKIKGKKAKKPVKVPVVSKIK